MNKFQHFGLRTSLFIVTVFLLFISNIAFSQDIRVLNIPDFNGSAAPQATGRSNDTGILSDYGYHLSGIRGDTGLGGSMVRAKSKLLNTANFGTLSASIVKRNISITDDFGTKGSITNISQLQAYDIIYIGTFFRVVNTGSAFEDSEIDILLLWSQQPGKVLMIQEQATRRTGTNANPVSSAMGYGITSSTLYPSTSVLAADTEQNTKLFSGVFGNVNGTISQAGLAQGYFSSGCEGIPIADNSAGFATILLNQEYRDILVSDTDFFTYVSAVGSQMSLGSGISTNADKVWANLWAWAVNEVVNNISPSTFITTAGEAYSDDLPLCSGSTNITVKLRNNNAGIIRWETSTNNGASWTTIASTSNTITYPNPVANQQFRAIVGNPGCTAVSSAVVATIFNNTAPIVTPNLTNICPSTTVNLATAHSGSAPNGTQIVWYTNNLHTGTPLSAAGIAAAGAGTYYAFYQSISNSNCYSSASNSVTVTISNCDPCDPVVWYHTQDDRLFTANLTTGASTQICSSFTTTSGKFNDIGFAPDKTTLYGVASGTLWRINTTGVCSETQITKAANSPVSLPSSNLINSLSFLPDGTAIIGASGHQNIYRVAISGNTYTASIWFTIPVENSISGSSGDFILLGDKVYAALTTGSREWLYEIKIDPTTLNPVASSPITGRYQGPVSTSRMFGMSAIYGKLYGGFSDSTVRELTLSGTTLSYSSNLLSALAPAQIYGMTSTLEALGQNNPSITAGANTNICNGDTVILTSTVGSGNQWYKDGVAISGATASTYTATQAGTYSVRVQYGTGCFTEFSNPIVVTSATNCPTCPVVMADLMPYVGTSPSDDAFSNNQIKIGNNRLHLDNTTTLSANLFTPNIISQTHYAGEPGIQIGHNNNEASGLPYDKRITSTLSFDTPMNFLRFTISDLDLGDNVIVNAYDENNILINLTASNYYIYFPTNLSRVDNRFYPPNANFTADSDTRQGTVDINFNGKKVSKVEFIFYDTSFTGSYTISKISGGDCPPTVCYEDPGTSAIPVPVKHGITVLARAGIENGNWPMLRNSAYTALESKTKGFVITRNANPEGTLTAPVVGMMVFDTDADAGKGCLKIYTGSGAGEGWKCFSNQTCP